MNLPSLASLGQRTITALPILGIVVLFLYRLPLFGGLYLFAFGALALSFLCAEEVQHHFLKRRCRVFVATTLVSVCVYACGGEKGVQKILWALLFSQNWLYHHRSPSSPSTVGASLLFIWITAPFNGLFSIIHNAPSLCVARKWISFLLITVKGGDVAAYLVGNLWGRHRWIPAISPNKTLEGGIAALLWSLCVGTMFGWWYGGLLWCASMGLALSILGQWGDAIESMFKRSAQVKHSGTLPGIGGVLDLMDSVALSSLFLASFDLT